MITTLTGSNSFLLKNEVAQRVREFVAIHSDLALERLDAEEASYEQLLDALQNLPFLSSKKLVIVQNAGQKQFTENLEHIIDTIPDSNNVVLVIPKIDRRAKYSKLLKSKTDYQECNDLDESGLASWLVNQAKAQGGTVSTVDARFLVDRVGPNQLLLQNELDKLLSYSLTIARDTIEALCEPLPQSTVFQLMDAAFTGNTKQALALYDDQRRQKVEPLAIVGMIAWQLHILAIIKAAGDRPVDEIAKVAKLHPFVVRKNRAVVQKLTLPKLKELVQRALELDVKLKSQAINADDALKYYLLTLGN